MAWDRLVQQTGKYRSIRHMEYPKFQTGIFGRMESAPVLNGCVNTIDWDQNQSDLSDLTLSMRRVKGSPWFADFGSWTWPEVAISVANQKDRGLWERDCVLDETRTAERWVESSRAHARLGRFTSGSRLSPSWYLKVPNINFGKIWKIHVQQQHWCLLIARACFFTIVIISCNL